MDAITQAAPSPDLPETGIASKPQSAAEKTADAVREYLEECDRKQCWPDRNKVEEIFATNFAPIVPRMVTLRQVWRAEILKQSTNTDSPPLPGE